MNSNPFGEYISYLRTSRNYSLRELAEMIGISPYYLCSIENGRKKNPNIKILGKMYLAFDLRKEELLDLYAKANDQASADIVDYIMENDKLRSSIRDGRDEESEMYWREFIERIIDK